MFGLLVARRDLIALALAAVCWGTGTVVSKAALDEIPPLTLLPVQLAASVAVLSLLMRREGVSLRMDGPALLGRLGILNPGIAYALSLLGLVTITASLSVLLWAFEPLMILFLAGAVLREPLPPRIVVLSLAALAGIVVVVYEPSTSGELAGVALTVAGVACCAAYTVIARHWLPAAAETSQVVLWQQAHALAVALTLVLVVGVTGGAVLPSSLSPLGVASAIGSGVLYYGGAYWFYLGALRRVHAAVAALSFYLIPLVGISGGALLLGDRLDPRQWAGVVVVLVSLVVMVVKPTGRVRVASLRP
jgi:probable blue pigment (indigoidine) exporter